MTKTKTLFKGALCVAAALAMTFTACSDDSSSSSGPEKEVVAEGDLPWFDPSHGIFIYPNGNVINGAGEIVGTVDIATGVVTIGENTITVDLGSLEKVDPNGSSTDTGDTPSSSSVGGNGHQQTPANSSSSSVGGSSSPASSNSTPSQGADGTPSGWSPKLPASAPAATANAQASIEFYKIWKDYFVQKLSTEKKAFPGIGADFGEVFGTYMAEGKDPARVIWQTYGDSKCWIDEAKDAGYPNMTKRGCTVSEGVGYGMMISVLMEDWDVFNGIWYYSKGYRESAYGAKRGLMPWLTFSFSWNIPDKSSATDADLDIATSLIIAYKKTGYKGYLEDAKSLVNALWEHEINPENLLIYSGDTPMWHTADPVYNLCYFSPVAIRLFAEIDPAHNWDGVLDAMYTYMKKVQDAGTGVFPDWSNTAGVAVDPNNGSAAKTYWTFNKESVRIPWRISWDYLWYQDERAADILKKLNDFIVEKSAGDAHAIPSENYSWDPTKEDVVNNTLSAQWQAAWCATGLAGNSTWVDACTSDLNATEMKTSTTSYFTNILQMIYSELLNGWFVKPN